MGSTRNYKDALVDIPQADREFKAAYDDMQDQIIESQGPMDEDVKEYFENTWKNLFGKLENYQRNLFSAFERVEDGNDLDYTEEVPRELEEAGQQLVNAQRDAADAWNKAAQLIEGYEVSEEDTREADPSENLEDSWSRKEDAFSVYQDVLDDVTKSWKEFEGKLGRFPSRSFGLNSSQARFP